MEQLLRKKMLEFLEKIKNGDKTELNELRDVYDCLITNMLDSNCDCSINFVRYYNTLNYVKIEVIEIKGINREDLLSILKKFIELVDSQITLVKMIIKSGKVNIESALKQSSVYHWTDKVIYLVELAYATISAKSINHGDAEFKAFAEDLASFFNIEVKNVYVAFNDIKKDKAIGLFILTD